MSVNWQGLLDETALAALLPADKTHFAQPVCESLAVFLAGLPAERQQTLFAQQTALSPATSLSERLGRLAQGNPVLHKIGQVLARDQRLSRELRRELRQLEALPPRVPLETIEKILHQELGSLKSLGISLTPPALAEASVAVVIPFTKQTPAGIQHGVFKVLKPNIERHLDEGLRLLQRVGAHLDQRCEELGIPHLDYQESFQQVREKLLEEIRLQDEQDKLLAAGLFYAAEPRVQIPTLYECCTPRVTAMERVWGDKVTDHAFTGAADRRRLAELVVDAMIAQPVFARQNRALFHCDPHAGNLFLTIDNRLAILDWSLVGWLDHQTRAAISQILLAAVLRDRRQITRVLCHMTQRGTVHSPTLSGIVGRSLMAIRRGKLPGLAWLLGLLDKVVQDAGLRLSADMMLFRKSLYTLEGVVAEVGGDLETFDRVLSSHFLHNFLVEWPNRWLAPPNSREFATRLSNFDLMKTLCNLPASIVRYWFNHSKDFWNANCTDISIRCH